MIPFNPLDKKNLGLSVANAMLAMAPVPLAKVPKIPGAGIYAIYYKGDFAPYRLLTELNSGPEGYQYPIYVGKADPKGSRTGMELDDEKVTYPLRDRLTSHAKSIADVENLALEHFSIRMLVVEPIFIPLGETMLITQTGPLWNRMVPGFGSNAPGAGRKDGRKSHWDTLHPGRVHSQNLAATDKTPSHTAQEVREYLRSRHEI